MEDILRPFDPDIPVRKIDSLKEKFGGDWWRYFFGNFDANLPGGYLYIAPKNQPERKIWRESLRFSLHAKIWADNPWASEKRKKQTGLEFLREVQSAIKEAGLTTGKIIRARLQYREPVRAFGQVVGNIRSREFYELIAPIYIILRKRGYNHYSDLTA